MTVLLPSGHWGHLLWSDGLLRTNLSSIIEVGGDTLPTLTTPHHPVVSIGVFHLLRVVPTCPIPLLGGGDLLAIVGASVSFVPFTLMLLTVAALMA